MTLIKKTEIEELNNIHSPFCISIFIPTHRAGEAVLERQEKMAMFKQYDGTGKTSSDIRQVVPASIQGKIDTLFVENRADIWGIYDPEKQHVELHEEFEPPNVSLLNKTVIQTFLNGGNVYLLEKEEMPNPYSKVNALYRY